MSMAPVRMYELVERVKDRLTGVSQEVVVAGYGHYGDGNLHLNVSDGRGGLQQVSPPPGCCLLCLSGVWLQLPGLNPHCQQREGSHLWLLRSEVRGCILSRHVCCVQDVQEALEPFVYEWVSGAGGSVSAEHGIGLLKRHAIHYSQPPQALALMRKIKGLLDPHGIMNPGKVLP